MNRSKLRRLVLIAALVNGCAAHTASQIGPEAQMSHPEQVDPSEKSPAIIVHIDPQTGQIITPPATLSPGQVPQSSLGAAEKTPPQLQQKLSPVPGGGVMIELDDRFQTPLTATIDADGKVRLEHKPAVSSPNEQK